MSRPLMRLGVGQLEEMFTKGKSDPKVLKDLEHELQYRQVPRAVALLAEVQATMHGTKTAPPPAVTHVSPLKPMKASDGQPDLWHQSPVESISLLTVAEPTRPTPTMPAMPLNEAYKVLKATPGSTWESIEQTRRSLVQQASPVLTKSMSAEKRVQIQAEVRRANAAYATLLRYRTEGR